MRTIEFNDINAASVTQMRLGGSFGVGSEELVDGNMIPRLCEFAGASACAQACQLKLQSNPEHQPKLCAEENITEALESLSINPENFAIIAATADNVGFGDDLNSLGAGRHDDGYTTVPACNAFFFRPKKDRTYQNRRNLTNVAMRMADCGDVVYAFKDSVGDDVVGIAHYSRTNMKGPSAYIHELDGKKVSWGEYVLGSAVQHYGADPQSVNIKLIAAVEGKNFIHHYSDQEKMEGHFAGWKELGFMHPEDTEDFDCLIDYREMIQWQLRDSIQDPALQLSADQIEAGNAIDTGNLDLGHASHHAATKGSIVHGRDLYQVGLNRQENAKERILELKKIKAAKRWYNDTFGDEMSEESYDSSLGRLAEINQELKRLHIVLRSNRIRQ